MVSIESIKRLYIIDESENITILTASKKEINVGSKMIKDIQIAPAYYDDAMHITFSKAFRSCKEYILFPINIKGETIRINKNISAVSIMNTLLVFKGTDYTNGHDAELAKFLENELAKFLGNTMSNLITTNKEYRREACQELLKRYHDGIFTPLYIQANQAYINHFKRFIRTELDAIAGMIELEENKTFLILQNLLVNDYSELDQISDYVYDLVRLNSLLEGGYNGLKNSLSFENAERVAQYVLLSSNVDIEEFLIPTIKNGFSGSYSLLKYIQKLSDFRLKQLLLESLDNPYHTNILLILEFYKRNITWSMPIPVSKLIDSCSTMFTRVPIWPECYTREFDLLIKDIFSKTSNYELHSVQELVYQQIRLYIPDKYYNELLNTLYLSLKNNFIIPSLSYNYFKDFFRLRYDGSKSGVIEKAFSEEDYRSLIYNNVASGQTRFLMMLTALSPAENLTNEDITERIELGIAAIMELTNSQRTKYVKFLGSFIHSKAFPTNSSISEFAIMKFIDCLSKTSLKNSTIEKIIKFDYTDFTWRNDYVVRSRTTERFFGKLTGDFMEIVFKVPDRRSIIDAAVLQVELS